MRRYVLMGPWRPNPGAMNLEDPMATDAKLQHSALPALLAGMTEKQTDAGIAALRELGEVHS